MSDDVDAIVCGSPDNPDPISGSRVDSCFECGTDVLVAPTGQELIADGARPLCIGCGIKAIEGGRIGDYVPLSVEQRAEIRRHRRGRAFRTGGPS